MNSPDPVPSPPIAASLALAADLGEAPAAPEDQPTKRSLGPLRMVFAAAAHYPAHVAVAGMALVVTALATLAIPAGFRLIIDRGFAAGGNPADIGRWFEYLLMIVVVLALGTAVGL